MRDPSERRVAAVRRESAARAPASFPRTRGQALGQTRSPCRRCRSSAASVRLWPAPPRSLDTARSSRSTRNPPSSRVTAVTRSPVCSSAPASRSAVSSASRTSRALLLSGNSLPSSSSCSAHAEIGEKRGGPRGRKRAQHAAHDARGSAPEILLGDLGIRDVAARTAADEDLRADARCPVDADDPQRRARYASRRSPSPDPRRRRRRPRGLPFPQPYSPAQLYLSRYGRAREACKMQFHSSRTRRLRAQPYD